MGVLSGFLRNTGSTFLTAFLSLQGQNAEWQLGNGRRSNLAVPQHLPPLPHDAKDLPASEEDKKEWNIESRMPHNRLQLTPPTMHGKHRVEETMVAGHNMTAVYWKIVG